MVVVVHPDLAAGFQLAGVETAEARTSEEAERLVEQMILGSDVGLIAVSEDLQRDFGPRVTRLLRQADLPLLVPFPGREASTWNQDDRVDYVAALIRSAIGYHLRLTR
jgi:vacuolar-type H+-ATPase subunit F/Vma7